MTARRRGELAAFLRSRRARVSPADVGIPPGLRRRTAGLRREEVALLSGVGVTWYTWLEQGRPINASTQILDAVARTLRLDATEHAHLYRLAEVPTAPTSTVDAAAPGDEVQEILDRLAPLPACVQDGLFTVVAWNAPYAVLWQRTLASPDRNVLRQCLVIPPCCSPFATGREAELRAMSPPCARRPTPASTTSSPGSATRAPSSRGCGQRTTSHRPVAGSRSSGRPAQVICG